MKLLSVPLEVLKVTGEMPWKYVRKYEEHKIGI